MVDGGDIIGVALGAAIGIYVLKQTGLLDTKKKMAYQKPMKFGTIKPLRLYK